MRMIGRITLWSRLYIFIWSFRFKTWLLFKSFTAKSVLKHFSKLVKATCHLYSSLFVHFLLMSLLLTFTQGKSDPHMDWSYHLLRQSYWAVELVAEKNLFISTPCSELIIIFSRGYLLDTLLRLYVRYGFHIGHGGK